MPKKVIENLEVMELPFLPQLSTQKNTRVITKHYCNIVLYLTSKHTSLFTWLIYQVNVDNSFKYEERLLVRYCAAITEANKLYNGHNYLPTDIKIARETIKELIERGYILPTSDTSIFILNPLLTYHPSFCKRNQYKEVCKDYSEIYEFSRDPQRTHGEMVDLMTTGIANSPFARTQILSVSFANRYRNIKK